MSRDEDRLLRLAARISYGNAIDWDEAEARAGDEEERAAIRRLRLVSGIASAHAGAVPGPTDATTDLEGGRQVSRPCAMSSWGGLGVLEKLGEGGFAEVFRVWDPNLERHAALKLLFPRVAAGAGAKRILEEGRMLARVRHPNVVEVFGAEEHGGRVGIWMEYLKGRTLDDLLHDPRAAALLGEDQARPAQIGHLLPQTGRIAPGVLGDLLVTAVLGSSVLKKSRAVFFSISCGSLRPKYI